MEATPYGFGASEHALCSKTCSQGKGKGKLSSAYLTLSVSQGCYIPTKWFLVKEHSYIHSVHKGTPNLQTHLKDQTENYEGKYSIQYANGQSFPNIWKSRGQVEVRFKCQHSTTFLKC